ncbi:reverse transcriptase domain-containing protein, partial [Tanacetum coccineum]
MEEEEELPEPWFLFTDGSSYTDGSGAGLILTNPEGMEFTYALRFRFDATNNEAEYEALIARLKITEQMGVKNLQANVDKRTFKAFSIKQVPRRENKKADALSKIASTSFAHLSKQVLVEELKEKSISAVEVLAVVEEEGDTWMTPIFKYLMDGTLSVEVKKARAVKRKSYMRGLAACMLHPQTNGLAKRANRSLGEGIKTRLDERSKNWMEELPHVLWAHRSMIKSSNGDTPFLLTYGTKAVIPAEIGKPTIRTSEVDLVQNDEALEINLDLLEERREQAAIREAKKKSKDGEEGPYEVTEALGKGTYKLRDRDGKQLPWTWNISNLKKLEPSYLHNFYKKADALSKIASTSFARFSKQVLVEELKERSISTVEVLAIVEEEGDTWMTPIFKYLMDGTLPIEVKKARAVKLK